MKQKYLHKKENKLMGTAEFQASFFSRNIIWEDEEKKTWEKCDTLLQEMCYNLTPFELYKLLKVQPESAKDKIEIN